MEKHYTITTFCNIINFNTVIYPALSILLTIEQVDIFTYFINIYIYVRAYFFLSFSR